METENAEIMFLVISPLGWVPINASDQFLTCAVTRVMKRSPISQGHDPVNQTQKEQQKLNEVVKKKTFNVSLFLYRGLVIKSLS